MALPSTSSILQPIPSYQAQDNEIANMLMSAVTSNSHLDKPSTSFAHTPQKNQTQQALAQQQHSQTSAAPPPERSPQSSPAPEILQSSGSMRKRGQRGRRRNRNKSQAEVSISEPNDEPKTENENGQNQPPQTSGHPHWQGISIDLNTLFSAAAAASNAAAVSQLSPRNANAESSTISPVLQTLFSAHSSTRAPSVRTDNLR